MTKRQVTRHTPGTAMTIGGPLPRRCRMIAQSGLAQLLAGVSISAAALVLAAIPQQARAQAVNGTPTVQFGADAPVRTTTSDSFNVTANDALIDWAVTDNTVFLNSGTTLSFARDGGAYTVFNRVASSPLSGTLAISGRVQSDPQGKIWFYNPGGWVVSNGATIDVGSLVLTANPIAVTSTNADGQKFLGSNGQIQFGQAAVGSSVTVSSGASITASQSNSYVALVAPRVLQAGSVTSNGSTAYVAAGAVDITINNGLFDIVVSNGTDDPNGVVHSGSTTGTVNNSSSATPQGIYLVAVPKNDALTMLVSGNLGYNSASSANIVGGKITLSSGHDTAGGMIDLSRGGAKGDLAISNATFLSDVDAAASRALTVTADGATAAVTSAGALTLNAQNGATGGSVSVTVANGGNISVAAQFEAHADGAGARVADPLDSNILAAGVVGANATGGTVAINLGEGTFKAIGDITLTADAQGGLGGASAGTATAGTVSLSVGSATTFQNQSTSSIYASASANRAFRAGTPGTGAAATAGAVTLNLASSFNANTINTEASATAIGGADLIAQNATAGSVSTSFTGGTVQLGSLLSYASATAVDGGVANGGANTLIVDRTSVSYGAVSLQNNRQGNAGSIGSQDLIVRNAGLLGSNGGSLSLNASAQANTSGLIVGDRVGLTNDGGFLSGSQLTLVSDASAGSGFGRTDARGGTVLIDVKNVGTLDFGVIRATASGVGGSGSGGGDGTGGTVTFTMGSGSVTAFSGISLLAEGFAGLQQTGAGRVGLGLGGTAALNLTDPRAFLVAGTVRLSSLGTTGSQIATLSLLPFSTAAVALPPSSPANGGNGVGGTSQVTVLAGLLSANLVIDASGEGGNGFSGGNGGRGSGGSATLTVSGGDVSPFNMMISADGRGGFGADFDSEANTGAGAGGIGTGGGASFALTGGVFHSDSITLSATGNAPQTISFGEGSFVVQHGGGGSVFGDGPAIGGVGGLGVGGTTSLTMTGGSLANISGLPIRSISLDSRGVGGNGGNAFSNSGASQLTRGSGGTGRGGTSDFTLSKGDTDFSSVKLNASGSGGISGRELSGIPGPPSNGGNGGSGFGGNATIRLGTGVSAIDGFDATRSYSVLAGGSGADGGSGAIGGSGGAGQGGNAALRITAPDVFVDQFSLDAYSYGGDGGSSGLGNNGGSGGNGIGGTTQLLVDGAGVTFTAVNGLLDSSADAGSGGSGGSGQVETLNAAGNGGTAGAGLGGTILFSAINGATLDIAQATTLDLYAYGSGGTGGDGGNAVNNFGTAIGNGGTGGNGSGGAINVVAQDGTVLLGNFTTNANGEGGNGGGRLGADGSSTDASNGGSGGNGFGGNVSLTASGLAGSIQAASLDIHVDGFGGSGVEGQGYDPTTFVGASGGAGVAGSGGTIRLDAFDRGTITIAPGSMSTLTANGRAAFGGTGAQGGTNPVTGVGGAGGTGGNSGQGNGGTITLNAEGGLIETGGLTIFVNGYGRNGRQGGMGGSGIVPPSSPIGTPPAPNGAFGASGRDGRGVGGAVYITAQDDEGGAAGGLDLGTASLDVSGYIDFGGRSLETSFSGLAEISDTVDESNGGVNFTSLNVSGFGDPVFNPITLSISSREAPIRVAGGLTAGTGGTIDIVAIGAGGLEIGGLLNLSTDASILLTSLQGGLIHAGNIFLNSRDTTIISAQNCVGPLCPAVVSDNQLSAFTGGEFALDGFAQIQAGTSIDIRSRSNVTGTAGSGYRAPSIFVSAENNVTIRNAAGGSLDAEAGLISFGEGSFFADGSLKLGEDAGIGNFNLAGGLFGLAGTDIDITAGTRIDTVGGVNLGAADDIRFGVGARLTNTPGARSGFIIINAGSLPSNATPVAGNVASLLIGSGVTIDGTDGAVRLVGGAIDGRNATIRGASLSADPTNVPAPGVTQRNDNGQLSAPCLEGDICLGTIAVTGAVQIGLSEDPPIHFVGTGNISGASVAIASRETLTYGSAATPFTITSTGPIALTSQLADIALAGNALVDGGTVALSAGGSVTGNGRLRSAGDIGIDVGANITLASLTAGRQLTTVTGIGGALEPLYTLPGNLRIGTFQIAAPTAIRVGGSLVIDSATTAGNDLSLTAGTLVSLGTDSNVANLFLTGQDVAFATIGANGNIVLSASNAITGTSANALGSLTASGTTLTAAALQSGGAMSLTSSGATTLGTATSGADLTISSGALTFIGLTSTGATSIVAASVAGGDITTGTSLTARATGALVVGNANAGTTLSLNGASLAATTLRSGGAMSLNSSGAAQLGSATSGADLTVATGDLTFASFNSVGATQINASTVNGGGIVAGTTLAVTSAGAIRLGNATAAGTLNAMGTTLTASALQSGAAISLSTTGTTALGTARSGAGLAITSAALSFNGLTSTGATTIDAASVAGGDIAAGTSLTARATGALVMGNATAGTTLSLNGSNLTATSLRSGGAMTLTSSGAARLGTATSGGDLTVATGDLNFTGLSSTGATAISASTVAGGDIVAGTNLGISAPGANVLGSATAGGSLTLGGVTIAATSLRSGGATSLTSTGATTLGSASAGSTFNATGASLQFVGITAAGDVALTAATVTGGDATSTAGAIGLTASGVTTVGQLRAATDVAARATTLTFAGITAGRNVTLDVITLGGTAITAGQDLTIRSVNDLTFETIAAGRNLSLSAATGAITVTTDIDAGGTVSLAGDAILIKAVGPLTVASVTADNGDIAISTDGLLRVSSAASRGDVTLTSTANSLILGPITAGRALATPQALNSSGTSKGTPGPGAITLSAAQAITLQGTVDALTALTATAGSLIDQRALAVGKTIAYRSADLTLGQTAALGQSNFTSAIALTNTGTAGALLGDVSGTTAGYRLDNAEFGQIHSGGDLSLAGGSSLTIGTLSASAASGSGGVADGNIGATSALALSTAGDLAVGGALALGNAAGNTLRLTSGSLTLDAGAGSVRLIEGSGHGGTLAITTGELSALTAAARTAIVGMDGNAINLRLAQNDGVSDGRTLLEAGSIAIAASGRVLIQNTALGQTFDARRGFVADSFAINTSGTNQSTTSSGGRPLIVINGTVAGQTGLTALRAVQVTGGFDDLSTVNGCRLFTATCGTPQFDPLRDLLEDEIGRGTNLDSGDAIGEGNLILINRLEPLGFEGVIDEPVTGSGNDDFLVPEAGTGDDPCEDDDKTKCDKPPAG